MRRQIALAAVLVSIVFAPAGGTTARRLVGFRVTQ